MASRSQEDVYENRFQIFDLIDGESADEDETPTEEGGHSFAKTETNAVEDDGVSTGSQYTPEDVTPSSISAASDSEDGKGDDGTEEEGEGEVEEITETVGLRHRSFLHHSNSSVSMTNAFAPPFYNRPPTPLPPSPSLTSLLRPPFSAATSRPTTPDSSENDTPNDTESAVTRSARSAPTVPRASPKVPTYEYYGFVLYLLSSLAFCKFRQAQVRIRS